MKLKICGMKYQDNMEAINTLQPDYMGFIFYKKSSRFFDGRIANISKTVKKTGVFVNASVEEIIEKIIQYDLQAIQLHGQESFEFCKVLKEKCHIEYSRDVEIIKVFSIKDEFDFSVLTPFETIVDYYLFDTKGKLPGGNGFTFDWKVLEAYPSEKSFFLSGGIGLETTEKIKDFMQSPAAKYCYALDVNSKFEIVPGLKNVEQLKDFRKEIKIM